MDAGRARSAVARTARTAAKVARADALVADGYDQETAARAVGWALTTYRTNRWEVRRRTSAPPSAARQEAAR
jgi:hypothetical protein